MKVLELMVLLLLELHTLDLLSKFVLYTWHSKVPVSTTSSTAVLALREVWDSETPKNCPGTSKNQCQEVWDSQRLKIFSHL